MAEVFGTFILSKSDQQYKGEFFNNKMNSFSAEDVRPLELSQHNEFIGTFDANWTEAAGTVSAVLEIDMESEDVYILSWNEVKLNGEFQSVSFTGRGVRRSGLLVCVYSMNVKSN